jgi:nicotinamide-nucleotide amidase
VVVLSGGLGPTADDHTVAVLAGVFGRTVERHPEASARMRTRALSRGYTDETIPANFYKQAEVLAGVEVLLNPVGLAPGMLIETERGLLAVLPGVPREMQAMFRELVLPALGARLALTPPRIFRAKILGQGESWAEARIQKCGIDFSRVEYGISARPGELLVKFLAHRAADHPYIDTVRALLEREFGEEITPLPEGLKGESGYAMDVDHASIVHRALLGTGLTVATAESCTGGAIAQSLTDHAGSSEYFLGSVVAYRDDVKERLLGVPREMLDRHGAVSAEVCEAMARGALERFGADLALAVTGIAGPGGGSAEKPVGLVYVGCAARSAHEAGKSVVERNTFAGNREMVRRAATVRALELLRRRAVGRTG